MKTHPKVKNIFQTTHIATEKFAAKIYLHVEGFIWRVGKKLNFYSYL